jgi:DNA-binding transcriptional MerR regulator
VEGRVQATSYSCKQVISITGVSQRQLSYWRRTGLVTPSHLSSGGHSRYSFTDLVIIRTIKQLLDAGISIQRVRQSIASLTRFLPTVTTPLTELTLVATGDVILVLHEGSAFEALSGQECILSVAQLARTSAQVSKTAQFEPEQQELEFKTQEDSVNTQQRA